MSSTRKFLYFEFDFDRLDDIRLVRRFDESRDTKYCGTADGAMMVIRMLRNVSNDHRQRNNVEFDFDQLDNTMKQKMHCSTIKATRDRGTMDDQSA